MDPGQILFQSGINLGSTKHGVIPNPPFSRSPGFPLPMHSRRTGAAWTGLCGVGHGMDFRVGALILMGVIMIGPKSEKGQGTPLR